VCFVLTIPFGGKKYFMIHYLEQNATDSQIEEMLESLGSYIKFAVDIDKKVVAGGGELHADCEDVLLEHGSQQDNIWGADWIPASNEVTFEALINIRPHQNNMSMEIQDPVIKNKAEEIIRNLLGK
jgi:hypothetical protein